MRVWLMAALLLAVGLAGCTEDDGTDDEAPGVPGTGVPGSDTIDNGRLQRPVLTKATEPIVITDSGASPDTWACVSQCPFVVHVLSDKMEPDTAYFLEATLAWAEAVAFEAEPWFFLSAVAGIRDYDTPEVDTAARTSTMSATLLAKGPHPIELRIGGNPESPDYSLELTMTPVPDAIPQYAAAAVAVPEGATLILRNPDGASGRVALFDDQDRFLKHVQVSEDTVALEASERDMEYVLWTLDDIWAEAVVTLEEDDSVPYLRHLALEITWNDLGTISDSGPVSFTFDVGDGTLQAAFRFGTFTSCGGDASPNGCYASIGTSAYLSDPSGLRVAGTGDFSCYLCGGGASYGTSYDDGPAVTGTYTVDYESDTSQNVKVQSGRVGFVR